MSKLPHFKYWGYSQALSMFALIRNKNEYPKEECVYMYLYSYIWLYKIRFKENKRLYVCVPTCILDKGNALLNIQRNVM